MYNQKYDQKTEKKLFNIYQDVIKKYSLENENLLNQVVDLEQNLELNHNLLYNFLIESSNNKEKIKDLAKKGKNILEKIESLLNKKAEVDIKSYKLQVMKENIPIKINEEINQIKLKNNNLENEMAKKEIIIKNLKKDLERARNNALFKEARTEVLISEPTKINVEKNVELIDVKYILAKVNKRHSKEKKRAKKLEKEINSLKEELNNLKVSKIGENNKDILSKINGYNINVENNDDEYEEEEEEKEESAEEDDSEDNKKNQKKKEKELEQLQEKYKKLKKDYEEFQNKINEYKRDYKSIKSKMENIKKKQDKNK